MRATSSRRPRWPTCALPKSATIIRLRLRARGIRLRSQVDIPGVGRVDFLIIEADSVEHHLPKYQSDRTRDRVATAMGYLMIRLTYEDVVYHWDTALADILAVTT